MSTDLNIEIFTEFVEQKLQNKPVDKLLGEPTIITYGILENQVAVAASAAKTSQWGGKHGHLALIVNKEKYRLITATTTNSVDRQVKPAGTNPNIDGKTSKFERIKLSRAQDEKIREFHLQEETDEQPKKKIIEAVEEEYLGKLKKDYLGYSDKTAKYLLNHLKKTCCKITTLDKGKALRVFRAPWDITSNITTHERHLDKAQLKCADMGVKAPNSEKVQIYVQQMYGADIFTDKEFIQW